MTTSTEFEAQVAFARARGLEHVPAPVTVVADEPRPAARPTAAGAAGGGQPAQDAAAGSGAGPPPSTPSRLAALESNRAVFAVQCGVTVCG